MTQGDSKNAVADAQRFAVVQQRGNTVAFNQRRHQLVKRRWFKVFLKRSCHLSAELVQTKRILIAGDRPHGIRNGVKFTLFCHNKNIRH